MVKRVSGRWREWQRQTRYAALSLCYSLASPLYFSLLLLFPFFFFKSAGLGLPTKGLASGCDELERGSGFLLGGWFGKDDWGFWVSDGWGLVAGEGSEGGGDVGFLLGWVWWSKLGFGWWQGSG